MISLDNVALFEAQDQVSRDDIYGPGELLFARKLNDGCLDVLNRIDAMIERKEGVRLPAPSEVRDEANKRS
jgi:hypothetical protein